MITILVGALLIGATLGMLGSGGSAITVPVLVYLVGHGGKVMREVLLMLAILAGWFVLNKWVLPKFGVST